MDQITFDDSQHELEHHWKHFYKLLAKFENTEFIKKAPREIVLKEWQKLKDVKLTIDYFINKMENSLKN